MDLYETQRFSSLFELLKMRWHTVLGALISRDRARIGPSCTEQQRFANQQYTIN